MRNDPSRREIAMSYAATLAIPSTLNVHPVNPGRAGFRLPSSRRLVVRPPGEVTMPLIWVPGQPFDALVDHAGGWRGRSCGRAPPAGRSIIAIESQLNDLACPALYGFR